MLGPSASSCHIKNGIHGQPAAFRESPRSCYCIPSTTVLRTLCRCVGVSSWRPEDPPFELNKHSIWRTYRHRHRRRLSGANLDSSCGLSVTYKLTISHRPPPFPSVPTSPTPIAQYLAPSTLRQTPRVLDREASRYVFQIRRDASARPAFSALAARRLSMHELSACSVNGGTA